GAGRAPAGVGLFYFLFDRHPDHVTPLGPGAVVVAHLRISEQLVEHEPAMRRALTDPAVDHDLFVRHDALVLVDGLQLIGRLEGTVLVDCHAPGDIRRPGDMPTAERAL